PARSRTAASIAARSATDAAARWTAAPAATDRRAAERELPAYAVRRWTRAFARRRSVNRRPASIAGSSATDAAARWTAAAAPMGRPAAEQVRPTYAAR